MFETEYKNKKIFITGHTGFKGSWLAMWLLELGAEVCGYALSPPSEPNHYTLLTPEIESILGDIRDGEKLRRSLKNFQPDIVFHLAAQPLVRRSYFDPVGTFETNMMGTVNLFEACRSVESIRAVVNITSDKCYENKEYTRPYVEGDPMGGYDPYSASKGCAELITSSYRRSFFPIEKYHQEHQTLIVSVRAGNVIGGGDWGEDRLVPDIMRATSVGEKVEIRSPQSVRPWQHVLEPLAGYLRLGSLLHNGRTELSGPWNLGPHEESQKTVIHVVQELQKNWGAIEYVTPAVEDKLHEAGMLMLDCRKAREQLGWNPVWDSTRALAETAAWYREFYNNGLCISGSQLKKYREEVQ